MKLHGTFLMLIFLMVTVRMNGQFVVDPISGCDTVTVKFTPFITNQQLLNRLYRIRWEFEPDTSYTTDALNPKAPVYYTYSSVGEYLPRMIVIDTNNQEQIFPGNSKITVYETPSAAFVIHDSLTGTFVREYVHEVPFEEDLIYRWIIGDSVMPPGTDRYLNVYKSEGLYRVGLIVESTIGHCVDTAFRSDRVLDDLSAPNFFSPNEDGMNDQWLVRSNGRTTYRVKIFARTGTLVFQAETPIITWDGRNMSGQKMSAGIYYYIIEPVRNATIYRKTGFFYLLM